MSTAPRPDGASGTGLATSAADGTVLDTWYPAPALGPDAADLAADLAGLAADDPARGVTTTVVRTAVASLADPPADAHDVYLRLHLLSHRLIAPHEANLDGIFGLLANVVWTNRGPCAVDRLRARPPPPARPGAASPCTASTSSPAWSTTCCPTGVRIADADRVRLGAHLAPGTTVMHEGFVNFNAGTLGSSMVEGRISAGVVVGDGSDVGGGASIMGTLSGGGKEVISIGKRCLLGANAGLGISLGDDCVVEAGLYVTVGHQGHAAGRHGRRGPRRWPAQDGLLFRRNSVTGAVEVLARTGAGVALNAALHAN